MALKKAAETALDPRFFPLLLYKRILRLHYGLPPAARFLGDEYVKAEFRAHRHVSSQQQLTTFFDEWMNYSRMLADQLTPKGIANGVVGKHLRPDELDSFADEQLRQLYDLKLESDSLSSEKIM